MQDLTDAQKKLDSQEPKSCSAWPKVVDCTVVRNHFLFSSLWINKIIEEKSPKNLYIQSKTLLVCNTAAFQSQAMDNFDRTQYHCTLLALSKKKHKAHYHCTKATKISRLQSKVVFWKLRLSRKNAKIPIIPSKHLTEN